MVWPPTWTVWPSARLGSRHRPWLPGHKPGEHAGHRTSQQEIPSCPRHSDAVWGRGKHKTDAAVSLRDTLCYRKLFDLLSSRKIHSTSDKKGSQTHTPVTPLFIILIPDYVLYITMCHHKHGSDGLHCDTTPATASRGHRKTLAPSQSSGATVVGYAVHH